MYYTKRQLYIKGQKSNIFKTHCYFSPGHFFESYGTIIIIPSRESVCYAANHRHRPRFLLARYRHCIVHWHHKAFNEPWGFKKTELEATFPGWMDRLRAAALVSNQPPSLPFKMGLSFVGEPEVLNVSNFCKQGYPTRPTAFTLQPNSLSVSLSLSLNRSYRFHVFQVAFSRFDLEQSTDCAKDYVLLRNGGSFNSPVAWDEF